MIPQVGIVLILAIAAAYCANPIFLTGLFIVFKFLRPTKAAVSDLFLFLTIAASGCLLQSTVAFDVGKNLPSDWYNDGYLGLFKQVGRSNWIDYILGADKEPGWRLLNFFGYYITGGKYFYFINFVAMATLVLTGWSIYTYWKHIEGDSRTLIACLALFFWFSEYISSLNNITRQLFALSIVTYALVTKASSGKTSWFALILACTIHTLSFAFVPFLFFRDLLAPLKPITLAKITLGLSGIALVLNLAPVLARLFAPIGFISYAFQRAANTGSLIDEFSANPFAIYSTAGLVMLLCLYILYYEESPPITCLFSNILLLFMAVSALTLTAAPALNLRLYISRFYFFPFVLPLFLRRYPLAHTFYLAGIILFFGSRFLSDFEFLRGGGFFPNVWQVLCYSLFDFIL